MQFRLSSLFYLLVLFCANCFSQQKPVRHYTTNDGLQNNAVRTLFLDSKGTLWAGTENGISYLVNGTFKNITSANGLGFDNCWAITEDNNHNLWFGSYDDNGGVSCFNGKTFRRFTTKNGLANNRIRKLLCFDGFMYVGTETGVSVINLKTWKVTTLPGAEPHKGVFIVTDFMTINNTVYFSAVNEGIYKIERDRIVKVISHSNIYSMACINDKIYCSNKDNLDIITVNDFLKGEKKISSVKSSILWDFVKGEDDKIYAAGWGVFKPIGGLYTVNGDKITNVSNEYGITSKGLLSVIYDVEKKILYCGSKDKGIYAVNLENIINYCSHNQKPVVSIAEFQDNIAILAADGLKVQDKNNKTLKLLTLSQFKNFQQRYISGGSPLPNYADGYYELDYNITARDIIFYEILKGNEYLLINSNIGVFKIDKELKITAYLPVHSYKIGFTPQEELIETIPYAGVHVYADAFYSLKNNWFLESDPNTPLDVVSILHTKTKTYLASIFKGLYVYDRYGFTSCLENGTFKEPKLKFITKNDKDNLIIATEYGDIYKVTEKKGIFEINEKIDRNRLYGRTISFIECYKNVLIIGTELGINIFKGDSVQLINTEQGFVNKDVKSSAIIDGVLWLGTNKGYYKIKLDSFIKDLPTVNRIDIENLKINNVPFKPDQWYQNVIYSPLSLAYTENTLEFSLNPSGHKYAEKLRYRFRLQEGGNWSPYSNKPLIYLPYLPSGNYEPEVEVMDLYSGKISRFGLPLINIALPFWKQIWFVIVLISVLILISLLIYYYKRKQIIQKALVERRLSETRHEALIAQMNPHFTFNAMNAIQNYIIEKDTQNSLRYIGKLAKLMRTNLENSRRKSINLEDEIAYLENYITIENIRFDNFITYFIDVDPEIDLYNFYIPAMLLQPFIENVFVHAFNDIHSSPHFIISLKKISNEVVRCTISDNGNGYKNSNTNKLHSSKSTLIVRERLELLQPELKDALKIKFSITGTEVVLLLKNIS
ncbi:histidine kinase [Flavobacterium rakeshii]|uniref:Histidine kinase n=1 Tax=Flavobacterium rakeshii TaxID=1038845 RepID=A0A6N8HH11_9FLAO|nr:histidine kinase [Flavobacterium rakeshii]MUV04990.1 histidine kinase [Flavobacterium rakeshii]